MWCSFQRFAQPYMPWKEIGSPFSKLRASSELLYWAIIAAGSRYDTTLNTLADHAVTQVRKAIADSLFGPRLSTRDFDGLLIYHHFLSPSRVHGHAIAVAYELGLQEAGPRLRAKKDLQDAETRPRVVDELRSYGYLWLLSTL